MKQMIFLLFILVNIASFAYDSFSKIIDSQEKLSQYLPQNSSEKWQSIYKVDGKTLESSIEISQFVDTATGEVLVSYSSDMGTGEEVLNSNMQLIQKSEVISKEEVIKRAGYDKIEWKFNKKDKTITIKQYLKGKEVDSKLFYEENNTIYVSSELLKVMVLKKMKDFNADTISPMGKYNVDFRLIGTDNLEKIAPEHSFPEKFKAYLKNEKGYKVYIMALTGLPSFVYPHKFYFAFSNDEKSEMIAYWGGDPKVSPEYKFKIETSVEPASAARGLKRGLSMN